MILGSWRDGWRRVAHAPAVVAGVFAWTLVIALPLAFSLRALLAAHLGRSAMAVQAAEGVNYDWWQEFVSQTTGLGATFTPAILGFAATLDNIASIADGLSELAPVTGALALYLAGWAFITGGVIDRYARQRRTRAHGFFAACGVYFWGFLRLALGAGLFYWWMFAYVHPWLFDQRFVRIARDIDIERTAFFVRLGLYVLFGALLAAGNLVFDYAKIRAVVEDRRSAGATFAAALRFVRRHPGRTLGLYALNTLMFVGLLAVWALIAPGAGGSGVSLWAGVIVTQIYIVARLAMKLHFLASQTALFQASLAHATYTAAPAPVWPESPAAETIQAG
jgi:hypothetical protein